ncbi:outer membrane beta-barrel protein [Chitinophaga sp. ysch24]|uniref:Outer membrane beta-barrel protein n=1 Tax=Chitinophaga tropicalis TaxID=2683588 RepID=A0A7K1UD19_9BACT|nr:outer membrane beta-barrel protein [Chitinophaga tropicalis]
MHLTNRVALRNQLFYATLKRVCVFLLICLPFKGFSQSWQAGGFLGISNYSGDLVQQRVDLKYTRYSIGAFVKRDINRYLTLRAGLTYGRIAGADSTNRDTLLLARNLSFRSPVFEAQLAAEINFLDLDVKHFTPYVFGGVALFSFYPTTKDARGNTVNLRPLSTEGQGMAEYPTRKQYNLRQFSIPFGAGIKILITDNWIAGFEIGLRKTFTDYLDDVSLTYVDQATLLRSKGPTAVEVAYRGDEVNPAHAVPGTYPADGTIRGSAKYKDWYAFTGFTLSYRFGGGGRNVWGRQKASSCPRF